MKVVSIVGARPQFIKAAQIVRALDDHNKENLSPLVRHILVHTGQHYNHNMSKAFFAELDIPNPKYNLAVGSGTQGAQTGKMLEKIERKLLEINPNLVIVYGDTNSTLAGALASVKLHIPIAHVEAGLRSYNKRMPEEINRVLTDHSSNLLLCPTTNAVDNLFHEGFGNIVNKGKLIPETCDELGIKISFSDSLVVNVGDVMLDSILHYRELANSSANALDKLSLSRKKYLLATVHRAENTDNLSNLKCIFSSFHQLAGLGHKIVCPLHPRTQKALEGLKINLSHPNLMIIEPVTYLEMLSLEDNAQLILTDSGGVQKEAFFFNVPCLTLRNKTEWPETTKGGWNQIIGTDRTNIVSKTREILNTDVSLETNPKPFGNGKASSRIAKLICSGI